MKITQRININQFQQKNIEKKKDNIEHEFNKRYNSRNSLENYN